MGFAKCEAGNPLSHILHNNFGRSASLYHLPYLSRPSILSVRCQRAWRSLSRNLVQGSSSNAKRWRRRRRKNMMWTCGMESLSITAQHVSVSMFQKTSWRRWNVVSTLHSMHGMRPIPPKRNWFAAWWTMASLWAWPRHLSGRDPIGLLSDQV